MAKKTVRIGVLASTTGPYAAVGITTWYGVMLAIDELRSRNTNIEFDITCCDPQGDNDQYFQQTRDMLQSGIRHVIGCYTSSSRKIILPLFEKYEALLWYPAHYEGFESTDHAIYTGTAPNHHIYPMIEFMTSNFGHSAYCIGSDYIWAWESNRVFKDEFTRMGGTVLGERYQPVGGTSMSAVIDEIFALEPTFILNTLIGKSSYHFFREFRARCIARGIEQTQKYPIASCNLSEADLDGIGTQAMDGHYSSSVYFSSVDSVENKRFVEAYHRKFPEAPLPPVEVEAAYIATHLLAAALEKADADDLPAVREAVCQLRFQAPQGLVYLDPVNFHSYLTPRIGLSKSNGEFQIVAQANAPVRPDPYLVNSSAETMLSDHAIGDHEP